MRLIYLRTEGLKAHDLELSTDPVTAIVGENGEGKSTAVIAIYLLVVGRLTAPDSGASALDSYAKVPATGDGVMMFARDDRLVVEGVWLDESEDGPDRRLRVVRSWTRDRKGKVSETLTLTGFDVCAGTAAQKAAYVRSVLGPALDLFFPADLLSLSPKKLRDRLLATVPADELGVAAVSAGVALADPPSWVRPRGEHEPILAYLSRVSSEAKARIADERAELKRQEAALAEFEDALGAPETSDGIRSRLSSARAELAAIEAHEAALERLAEAEAALAEIQSTSTDVAAAEQEALEAEEALDEAKEDDRRLAAAKETLQNAKSWAMRAAAGVREASPATQASADDLSEAKAELARVERTHKASMDVLQVAEGARRVFGEGCPLPNCPDCGVDLRPAFLASARDAEQAYKAAEAQSEATLAALRAAEQRVTDTQKGVALTAAMERLDEAKAAVDAAQRVADSLRVPEDLRSLRRRLEDARAEVASRRSRQEAIDDAAFRLEVARADADSAPARSRAEVEAAIAELEAELEALGADNARREARDEAAEGVRICREQIEAKQAVLTKVNNAHLTLLAESARWLESRLSGAVGRPVQVTLEDARGNETCRLEVGGVPVLALSGAETVRFLAALAVTLASASGARWRPLVLDRFEAVSRGHREAFLQGLVEAQRQGHVTDVLLTGCPDFVPEVPGVRLLVLRNGEVERVRSLGAGEVAA